MRFGLGLGLGFLVGVGVGVEVWVRVRVRVGVGVGVGVGDAVRVSVRVGVGVRVTVQLLFISFRVICIHFSPFESELLKILPLLSFCFFGNGPKFTLGRFLANVILSLGLFVDIFYSVRVNCFKFLSF